MLYSFMVLWQGLGTYLSFCFLWFPLCGLPGWQSSLFGWFFFFFCWVSLGPVVWPRLGDLFVSQNPREFYATYSRWKDSGLHSYLFVVRLNLNFLYNSQWITFPTQSCLVLSSFCSSLLHSLIMWLIVSSLLSRYFFRVFFHTSVS